MTNGTLRKGSESFVENRPSKWKASTFLERPHKGAVTFSFYAQLEKLNREE